MQCTRDKNDISEGEIDSEANRQLLNYVCDRNIVKK